MRTNIISIGNSKGVILPSSILKELKLSLKSSVQILVENDTIVIKAAPRQGWEEAAMEMRTNGDDKLLMPDVFENENLEEWTWEDKTK